eukprot:TRINITY_DN1986_c0_g1_i1.p1 TRINITY_DN1986_c0_g1~~TRINITY_DN1986_c0_g1_i1.p1  ORF type:complete len:209 (-),score=40.10 TRINITY_DN1986_c0_g1_i1:91-717(-)
MGCKGSKGGGASADGEGLRVNGKGGALPEGTPCDVTFKIVIVGNTGVGKTSLIMRFADGVCPQTTNTTVNFEYKEKAFKIKDKAVKLQVWDTAGQERFRTISSTFYRGAQGIILAYDVGDEKSFTDTTRQWLVEVERYATTNPAKLMLGMKVDKEERVVTEEVAKEKAEEIRMDYMELSSKQSTDEDINKPFLHLAEELLADYESRLE